MLSQTGMDTQDLSLCKVLFWQAWELTSERWRSSSRLTCLSREKSRSCLSYTELFRWWTTSHYCAWRWHLKVLVLCVCVHTGDWKAMAEPGHPSIACPGLPGFWAVLCWQSPHLLRCSLGFCFPFHAPPFPLHPDLGSFAAGLYCR